MIIPNHTFSQPTLGTHQPLLSYYDSDAFIHVSSQLTMHFYHVLIMLLLCYYYPIIVNMKERYPVLLAQIRYKAQRRPGGRTENAQG
jgi:hypothetical protein